MNNINAMIRVDHHIHSTCRACDSNNLELLIDFGMMPLAGGFLNPEQVGTLNIAYPLRLARCNDCTLMQVLDTVPPHMIFSQYSYTSSATRTLIDHFEVMGKEIVEKYQAQGRLVVEFGCNDGVLMRPLNRWGARAIGVDPSDVAARASREQGWKLIQKYFDEKIASQIREDYGPARIVVGNNVFAHVEDVHTILRGIVTLLEPVGVYIFEVHYQGELVDKVQFDTVYHEHNYYYSVNSLEKLLRRHGLRVVDVEGIPIHAGSIRVTAAREDSIHLVAPRVNDFLEKEKDIDVARFVHRVSDRRRTLQSLVRDLHKSGKRIAAYGASGRMTIMLNYCGLGADVIEYVVDMSPLRYGKLVPGILVPIVPPEIFQVDPPEYAVLTAWNYEKEIIKKEKAYLHQGGRFIIPLPEIRILGEF